MYVGLPGAGEHHPRGKFTGTPLRSGFGRVDREDARRSLGLQADVPVVLITGGSQGARVLNEVVPAALQRVQSKLQVMHLSGLGNDAAVRHRYSEVARDNVAHVRAVAADMDRLFAAADLVICRGGGTTVAELMAVGRAAIIIPYPHHKDRQQLHNARVLETVGAAIIQEERDLDQDALTQLLEGMLAEPSRLRAMGDRGRKLRRLDAAEAILDDVHDVLASLALQHVSGEPASQDLAAGSQAGLAQAGQAPKGGSLKLAGDHPVSHPGPPPANRERGAAARRGGVA
tara:strand:- start:157 stop:1017 length:861 start_codon:yes stop_codon:yes gene_type:complete